MVCQIEACCPNCGRDQIVRAGKSGSEEQRYRCRVENCTTITFMLNYGYTVYQPGIKSQVVEMTLNGSGIRDTAHVLKINKGNSVFFSLDILFYYSEVLKA